MIGITIRLVNVAVIIPPITTRPSDCEISVSDCLEKASGNSVSIVVAAVIRMGRTRLDVPCRIT